MDAIDYEVLRRAVDWQDRGQKPWLITVLATWGSAPRPPGSLLAIAESGELAGSVSGGCVEEDLRHRLSTEPFSSPGRLSYGVSGEDARRFGLPCGGRLELLVEQPESDALRELFQALRQRRLVSRRLDLETGAASLHPASGSEPPFYWDETAGVVVKLFGPAWQLLLIGGGQIADYLTEIATTLDYRVFICDPREEYAGRRDAAKAEWLPGMPDDVVRDWATDERCAVITLAHDPKLDDMALMEALISPAFYVGALGSRASHEKRRERLRGLGLSESALGRLHAPVGLALGSRTPSEIAVAIAAELIAARHGLSVFSSKPVN